MVRKRKTLPKDFEETLAAGDIEALKNVFIVCELDAYGGQRNCTALGFDDCPEELARWLVQQGMDVDTPDSAGRTPLCHRAGAGQDVTLLLELGADVNGRGSEWPVMAALAYPETLKVLVEHGAELNTVQSRGAPLHKAALCSAESTRFLLARGADPLKLDWRGRTPLEAALQDCRNVDIPRVAVSSRMLLGAGCPVPNDVVGLVRRIGAQFEFYRDGFNPRHLDETEAALSDLYSLFGVTPVSRRTAHDGFSPISVVATEWPAQFDELWDKLVPSSGAARTVQGELIRMAGRISRELLDNGGHNWDRDFRRMRDALITQLGLATSVTTPDELADLKSGISRDDFDAEAVRRVTELAVAWVLANPHPTAPGATDYRR